MTGRVDASHDGFEAVQRGHRIDKAAVFDCRYEGYDDLLGRQIKQAGVQLEVLSSKFPFTLEQKTARSVVVLTPNGDSR
jgi:hypothetical protein